MMKKPNSFILFVIVLITEILAVLMSVLFAQLKVDLRYSMFIAFVFFLAACVSTVGIYAGFKYTVGEKKLKRLNRIGLFGNLFLFSIVLALMIYAALTPHATATP